MPASWGWMDSCTYANILTGKTSPVSFCDARTRRPHLGAGRKTVPYGLVQIGSSPVLWQAIVPQVREFLALGAAE